MILTLASDREPSPPKKFPESPNHTPVRDHHSRSKIDWSYQIKVVDKPDYERLEKLNTWGQISGDRDITNLSKQFTRTQGSKATFDEWVEFGGDTWTWDQCQKYFDMVIRNDLLLFIS